MPPKNDAKRKVRPDSDSKGAEDIKKPKLENEISDPLRTPHPFFAEAEENGIVLRKYYPREMSNARAQAYNNNEIPRPIEQLTTALEETKEVRANVRVKDAIVHWFKTDLRTADNRALWEAGEKAREAGVPLICIYVVSPQDFEAHLTAPVRVDFIIRTLHILKQDLAALDIPLYVETVEKRKEIPGRIADFMEEWGASHLFANMEYEVDELRREAGMVRMCADRGLSMEVFHDTCVVPPGALSSGSGNQYAVYTPWYRKWVAHVHADPELLSTFERPPKNPPQARARLAALFDSGIPDAPENKRLSEDDAGRLRALWPAGEHEAADRLERFCEERIGQYAARRDFPGQAATASISVHLAAGTLSARTAIRTARDRNKTKKLDAGDGGIQTWISEVAWRDFYRHILVHWPYVCMNKPFKPEYSNIEWSYDAGHFAAWCEGRTGFPLVDAAMRQLRRTGHMHNRCRMVAASFLAKDLLLDWRLGERFFMERLADGDFASNNGGWGFGASVGADPQPYFRVFSPLRQSERFDPDGDYIRAWLPELAAVPGRAVHDPYARGAAAQARAAGYPEPIVDHKESRVRALRAYRAGIGRDAA
ncbi:putative Deoxyribodipyrimidine photo-lyase [Rosellinia necatrix]|uniref:Putative Deoxyribodipyrimidine photo-lyase n=1 Tax=Rosellinia necatrix TaxID=77044 RepID=A0A1W2TIZ9_ROSNE|nr:putative Deoxyribodipyrimidine photo-lyase [Rosellinia necatrix]